MRATLFRHFQDATVIWSWVYNGLRMTSGIILLPLLLRKLGKPELGMFYVFGTIAQLVPIFDFGFSMSIGRFVSYAMAGAKDIKAQGMGAKATTAAPNYQILWQLLNTTRRLYRWMALTALFFVGGLGSAWISLRIEETAHPQLTWLAWAVTLLAIVSEVYFGWWSTFLSGMNEVYYSARLGALVNILKLGLTVILLLSGSGLLAFPIATLVSSPLLRYLARRRCLQLLGKPPATNSAETSALLAKLWPNSWRLGTQLLSHYFRASAPMLVCTAFFKLETAGMLGLSLQVVAMIQSLSSVWTQVRWPIVGQCLMRHDYGLIHSILRTRFHMQFLTFGLFSFVMILAGPVCIDWFSTKQLLPVPWLIVLAANSALEMHFSFWTTLMSMENKLPFLWPTVITNICSFLLALFLVWFTPYKMAALIVAPLLASSVFNYWYWPIQGANKLNTTWWKFVFRRAPSQDGAPAS